MNPGSKKRCGGIGDLLSGTIATYSQYTPRWNNQIGNDKLYQLAMACWVIRRASNMAFTRKGHSLIAPDIIEDIISVLNG